MAVAPQPAPLLTWEAYLAEGEFNRRYAILDGVREEEISCTNRRRQEICMNILERFRAYQRTTGHGRTLIAPFDVLITKRPLRIRQPDLLFISQERLLEQADSEIASTLTVAPELVVEVLSESDTRRVRLSKIEDYRRIGGQECWLVSPQAEPASLDALG
jgi:Uma2 family endonuclease